ncbi:MAG TPA: TIGR02679 family protein [Actinocrinis sp.]|nr:TIGR02679 family protein [Actinocrinis sp.]
MSTTLGDLRAPAYRRLFLAARRSLERTGSQLSGQVSVADPTDEERKALIGLTGQYRPSGSRRITVELAVLDAFTRAALGLSLPDAVVALDGRPLRHRPAERVQEGAERAAARAIAESSPLYETHPWFRTWIDELGPLVTRLANLGATARLAEAVRVLELVEQRDEDRPYLLPVLAEKATGDTKALNRGRTSATLVLRALALRENMPVPTNAEDIRILWDTCGVVADDLASRVLVLNLPATGDGLGHWLTDAARYGTPFQVTLHQLTVHSVRADPPEVYVCENPAVLRRAAQELGSSCPPVLCTEGRPSAAFHRLARILTAQGSRLHYHGDFDWDGVDMTNRIISRYQARPWQMTQDAYRAAIRTRDESVALHGTPRPTDWDPELAAAMAEEGVAVFEEAVIEPLIVDLRRLRQEPRSR